MGKKSLSTLVLLSLLTWGAAVTLARAESPLDFKLDNRLGVTVSRVYVSPHTTNRWEEDVLGSDVLRHGGAITIRFNNVNVRRGNVWDLKVVTEDGQTYTWTTSGFNLRQTSKITLSIREGTATATAEVSTSAD